MNVILATMSEMLNDRNLRLVAATKGFAEILQRDDVATIPNVDKASGVLVAQGAYKIVIYVASETKVKVETARHFAKDVVAHDSDRCMIVSATPLTSFDVPKTFPGLVLEHMKLADFKSSKRNHVYQPLSCCALSASEKAQLRRERGWEQLDDSQIPVGSYPSTDFLVRYHGWCKGDIIHICRRSVTNGVSWAYRIVRD